MAAKRLVEQRKNRGKGLRQGSQKRKVRPISSDMLVRAYQQEVERQQLMIRKAEIAQSRLIFVIQALKALLNDENFVTLLRAESLETLPQPLADLIEAREPM
jgi:ParB family chromosome partitioning protein